MIKPFVLALSMTFTTSALAEGPSCSATAAERKLAGAAKTSFMTKCEKDARATCEVSSKEKKLAGAAKSSFETKCMEDARTSPSPLASHFRRASLAGTGSQRQKSA